MNICIVGTGYVGLVAGVCFAENGHEVICVDIDERKISRLQRGEVPIYEPGLGELLAHNLKGRRIRFSTSLEEGVKSSEVIFIAVGTPQFEDGSADLKHVLEVARGIGRFMNGFKIIVDKSTVPVGTAALVRRYIEEAGGREFEVVSNPEFLKEGSAVDDFLRPDRVVIGVSSERAAEVMKELYAPFVRTNKPILIMDIASAELTKYAANAMLAARISFMNEIANLCERTGADVNWVRIGIGADARIGMNFLFPGIGYGGSCFPKDVQAFVRTAREHGLEFSLLRAVEEVNVQQKEMLVQKVARHFGEDLAGRCFAVWGLAFKPRTDDMREAPAITIVEGLLARGATVRAHDPEAMGVARGIFGDRITYHRVNYDALGGADALLVVTEWNEFRRPDFPRIKGLLKQPVIFDGRNIYDPQVMRELGFSYYPIGRPAVVPAAARS
jgi:UDPglucose 6-dehydrogenase